VSRDVKVDVVLIQQVLNSSAQVLSREEGEVVEDGAVEWAVTYGDQPSLRTAL